MVIRLGRNGKFLACSTYPDHKETRPLPGEETPRLEGDGEPCPQCGEGDARDEARPVRRVRRLLALPGVQLHQEGRPAAAGPAAVRGGLPQERGRDAGGASRAAHRERLLGVLRATRKCDFTTNDEPTGAVHDASDAAHADGRGSVARKGEAGICLTCGAAVELPAGSWSGCGSRVVRPTRRRWSGRRAAAGVAPRRPAAAREAGTGARRTTRSSGGTTRTGTGSRRKSE